MTKPLTKKEVKQLHDELLANPSFINELSDSEYKLNRIKKYAKKVIHQRYNNAINWVNSPPKWGFPEKYKNGGELKYMLQHTSIGNDIRKEENLIKAIRAIKESENDSESITKKDMIYQYFYIKHDKGLDVKPAIYSLIEWLEDKGKSIDEFGFSFNPDQPRNLDRTLRNHEHIYRDRKNRE